MKKIPTPGELGLSSKFQSWRSGQEDMVYEIATSQLRCSPICAPTGFGKSPAYIGAALITNEPTCIVTENRGLQDQLLEDFKSVGLVDLRGRKNYSCVMREDYTCEDGYVARCPYKGTMMCPSSQAEMRASSSKLVVTNYSKWTSSRKFGTGMSHFKRVIFDEGHHAPYAIAQAMQVILHHREIEEDLKLQFPVGADAELMYHWRTWAITARAAAEAAQVAAFARIQVPNPKASWVRHYHHMKNLNKRLGTLSTSRAQDWVVEEVKEGYKFDPIHPAKYAESALLFRIPKITVVSATLRPKTIFMMGIGKKDFKFQEFDSDFDPKRCPIYYIPTQRVDSKHPDMSLIWMRIDQIMSRRRDRKGIIHTVSYGRRDQVMQNSRYSGSMLFNPQGEAPTEMIELFRGSPPGTVLVSPSIGTGYDFPGRDCEWQFVCKIPFAPPSKIVKAREAHDPEYRAYQAMQALVQIFGRGMRSKTDSCENFICDDNFAEWFRPRFGHLAPKSFHGFYREVVTLPAPPLAIAA